MGEMQKMNHETNNHSSTGTSAKSTSSSKKVVAILGAIILIGVIIYFLFNKDNNTSGLSALDGLRPIQETIMKYDMEELTEVRKEGVSPLNLILVGNDIDVKGAELQNAIKPVISELGLKQPNANEATAIWFLSNNPENRDLRVGLLAYEWYLHHNVIINNKKDMTYHKNALSELPAIKKAIMENILPAYFMDRFKNEIPDEETMLFWSGSFQDVYDYMHVTNVY